MERMRARPSIFDQEISHSYGRAEGSMLVRIRSASAAAARALVIRSR
jgi:hypothetical protein